MKSVFICGQCEKKTIMNEDIPETNKNGNRIKCPKCNEWQKFNGTMEITNGNEGKR